MQGDDDGMAVVISFQFSTFVIASTADELTSSLRYGCD